MDRDGAMVTPSEECQQTKMKRNKVQKIIGNEKAGIQKSVTRAI